MYPTFSDLIKDLTGLSIPLPIQMFGLMVAFAFVAANYVITLELKRKEKEGLLHAGSKTITEGEAASSGELFFNGLFGFIIGFKIIYIILNYAEFSTDPQAALLSAKGNILGGIVCAAIAAYWAYSDKNKKKLAEPITKQVQVHPYQLMGNITIIAAVAGIIGAKLFHILENFGDFLTDPSGYIFSFAGLTFYGGLILGFGSVIIYTRRNNIPTPFLIDAAAPGLMLAYGVGRIGCQLSGDGDWGIVNLAPKPSWLNAFPDWVWSYNYPHNVINEGVPIAGCVGHHCNALPAPVFPTPFYEAVICIGLFFVLWSLRKRIMIPGLLFSIYLILNGVERFFIEKIRVNTLYHVAGKAFTQAELISSILVILGVVGIWLSYKNKNKYGIASR